MGNAPTKGLQLKSRGQKKYVHWDQAVPPWPPGKPHLVPGSPNSQADIVTIRWDPPPDDGGAPITGYFVEHRKSGTPHWIRSTKELVLEPELRLSGLEPGWRYQFRVTAENAADLLSDPGELSQPLTVAREYKPASMTPQFSLELKDIVAIENEKAHFIVNFHGIPTPKVCWYKDSFEVFSSRRIRVSTENGTSSLVIFQSAFNDEGEYKCTATNRAGHIITKAKLRLEAPPCIRIPRQYEDGLLFEKDEVIRLKVSVAGRPLPRVTWYHESDLIPFGGRYEVTNTERFSALRISEARRADRGEYQVHATSRLGEDIVAFLVTVTDRPMPPGRAKVVTVMGRSVTLSWSEPDDDGGCKIGNFIVEYYRLGWNVWLKAATCRQVTTTLGDLIGGSEYKFRVKAENPYGVSDASEESQIVFIPDPKRGIMERPVRGTQSQTDIPMPDQIAEKKRGRSKDSLMARETIQVKKRKEVETKKADKDVVNVKKVKSEEIRKVEGRRSASSLDRSESLRKRIKETEKKRSVEFLPDDVPETVKRRRKPSLEKYEPESVPKTAPRQPKITTPALPPVEPEKIEKAEKSDKGLKASLQFSVTKRRDSSGERDSGVSEGSYTTGSKQSFNSPLHPREDDSLLHGSSELMLVLLPQTGEQQREKETEPSAHLNIFGDSSVPPPMSLSAPELGGGEPLVTSPLRNAVSSTELLHEQAMARFYQAVAAEEAEKARNRKETMERKSAEPSVSITTEQKTRVKPQESEDVEMRDVSKKIQNKPMEPQAQDLTWNQRKQKIFQDRRGSFEGVTPIRKTSPEPAINLKSKSNRKEPTKMASKEEEEEELIPTEPEFNIKSILVRKEPSKQSARKEEAKELISPQTDLKSILSRKEPTKVSSRQEEEEDLISFEPEINFKSVLSRKEPMKLSSREEDEENLISVDPEINFKSILSREEPVKLLSREEEKQKLISAEPEINIKSILSRKEPQKLSSREEEEELFDMIRQKTDGYPKFPTPPERKSRPILRNRVEEAFPMPYEEKKPIETKGVEVKVELEEGDMMEDDYPEHEELEAEESLAEDNSEFDEEEDLYKRIEDEEEPYQPDNSATRRYDRFTEEEEEEETYHPRNMIPTSPPAQAPIIRTLERQLTPRPTNEVPFFPKSILKNSNTSFQQQLEEMIERPRGIVARELERSPPKSFREKVPPKQLLSPQLSSDTNSRSPSPLPVSPPPPDEYGLPVSPSPPPMSPTPEPELFYPPPPKSPSPLPMSPSPPRESPEPEFFMAEDGEEVDNITYSKQDSSITPATAPTVPSKPVPEIPPDESRPPPVPQRRAKANVAPPPLPEKPAALSVAPPKPGPPSEPPPPDPPISPDELARQKRMLMRKASIEEAAEEKRAMADHYGELIRDNTRQKRPSKRYMTMSEMKVAAAAAAARERERKLLMTPEPPRTPTPEPEPEPEPEFSELSPEQQNTIVEQSFYDRYTAPVQRAPTPVRSRGSRTPDLVLLRQSSRDRTRMPSTERFAAELSKRFPEVARRFSPERSAEAPRIVQAPRSAEAPEQREKRPEIERPITPFKLPLIEEPQEVTESKWRFIFGYLADLAMLLVACWLYAFKDPRYAIPLIIILAYRQIYQALKRKMPKLPSLPWRSDSS